MNKRTFKTPWSLNENEIAQLIKHFEKDGAMSRMIYRALYEGKKLKDISLELPRTTAQRRLRIASFKLYGKSIKFEGLRFTFMVELLRKGYSKDYVDQRMGYVSSKVSAQRRAASGYLSPSMRLKVLTKGNFECNYCGGTKRLEIDHIIPIIRGGKTILKNLQVLCKTCNVGKDSEMVTK